MIRSASQLTERTLDTQVCVVGSGAGGSVVASRLAMHGLSVVLLEEGDHHPAASMTQDELDMIPKLFQEEGRRATRDQSIMVMQGRALGGSSTHNTGLCVPVPEAVWERWRKDGGVTDSYRAVTRYLDRVMHALKARRVDEDEINENNRLLRAGADRLGLDYFLAHHNRLRCSGCGYCTLGCAYNRKVSVVHAFLPEGVAAGLDVVTGAEVLRISRTGSKSVVEARVADGSSLKINAPVVVVAAGAVHTPILLARSGLSSKKARRLRLHPFAPVGALFGHEVKAWRGVPQSIIIDGRAHFMRGERGGYLLMVAAAQPAVSAVMTPGMGSAHRDIMKLYPRLAAAGVLVHDESSGSVSERDDRKPLIDYWPNAADQQNFRDGVKDLARLYFAVGAETVVLPYAERPLIHSADEIDALDRIKFRRHAITLGSVHPQGTCPMGPRGRGVTDENGAVRGHDGVFVADASLFPTSVGVPPQVTTMALAWRVADHVAAERVRLLS